jgi:hypothetical protein
MGFEPTTVWTTTRQQIVRIPKRADRPFTQEPTVSAHRFFDQVDRGALALAHRLPTLGVGAGYAFG